MTLILARSFARTALVLALIAGAAGCASEPMLDTSDTAQLTYDGLYPVKGSSADEAWARPDIDISQYSKILLQGVGVEYRPGGESGRLLVNRIGADHYEMITAQKARLEVIMAETFLNELGKSKHFTLVSEPGPDVLLIQAALVDVVSFVPPEPAGRTAIYLRDVGAATLVMEIRDADSNAILARSVDRRVAGNALGMRESTRMNNATEVRKIAQLWARRLAERLDTYAAKPE